MESIDAWSITGSPESLSSDDETEPAAISQAGQYLLSVSAELSVVEPAVKPQVSAGFYQNIHSLELEEETSEVCGFSMAAKSYPECSSLDNKVSDTLMGSGSCEEEGDVYENMYFDSDYNSALLNGNGCSSAILNSEDCMEQNQASPQAEMPWPDKAMPVTEEIGEESVADTRPEITLTQDSCEDQNASMVENEANDTVRSGENGQYRRDRQPYPLLSFRGKHSPRPTRNFKPLKLSPSVSVSEKNRLTVGAMNMADSGIALSSEGTNNNFDDPENACLSVSEKANLDPSISESVENHDLIFDFSPARQKILSTSSGFASSENVNTESHSGLPLSPRLESVSSPLFSPIYFQPVSFKNLSSEYPVPPETDRRANEYLKLMACNANRRSLEIIEPVGLIPGQFADADGDADGDPPCQPRPIYDMSSQSEESLLEADFSPGSSHHHKASSDSGQLLMGIPFEELDRLTQMAAGARPKTRRKDGSKKRRKKKPAPPPIQLVPPSAASTGLTLKPPTSTRSHVGFSSGGDRLSPSIEDPFDERFRSVLTTSFALIGRYLLTFYILLQGSDHQRKSSIFFSELLTYSFCP